MASENSWLVLSEELVSLLFAYVDVRTLCTIIPCVCKDFDRISHDEYMWQLICQKDCNITSKTLPTWRQTLFQNYCKHFLSLDWPYLRKKYTDQYKAKLSASKCSVGGCSVVNNDDLWVCLATECNFAGCSRYKQKHALEHAKATNHAFNFVWQKLDFWCYHCMRFVGTKTPKETQHRNELRLIVGSPQYDKHEKFLVEAKQKKLK